MRIDQNIKQIYQTGLFSDVLVLRVGDEQVALVFILTRKLTVRGVSFVGSEELPRKRMSQGLEAVKSGGFYAEGKAEKAAGEKSRLCRPRDPRCDECSILAHCPTGQQVVRPG